jgi:hypothetical protein
VGGFHPCLEMSFCQLSVLRVKLQMFFFFPRHSPTDPKIESSSGGATAHRASRIEVPENTVQKREEENPDFFRSRQLRR